MITIKRIFLLYVILSFSACKQTDPFLEQLQEFNNNFEVANDQTFLIIPDIGCSGCIYKAMNFLEMNLETPNVYFIFTSITSKKDIDYKLASISKQTDKVFFDYKNLFMEDGLIRLYPKIYHFSNGVKEFEEEVNPENIDILDKFSNTYLY